MLQISIPFENGPGRQGIREAPEDLAVVTDDSNGLCLDRMIFDPDLCVRMLVTADLVEREGQHTSLDVYLSTSLEKCEDVAFAWDCDCVHAF